MSASLDAEPPKLATLKFQVTSVLGTGGNSTVMLVADRAAGGGRYALKVLKREGPEDDLAIERARAECEASAKLGHPAILKCHDFRLRRSWFRVARAELLMEYVEGKPLDALKGLEVGPAVLVAQKVAAALAHMHRRGVIHGDLVPSRVLVARNGQVKVRGYGLSQVPVARKVQVKSDPRYAAPERAKEKVVDEKVDIYAAGSTIYHALTGRPPGDGRAEGRKISTPAALNPKVPAPLNELVVACLQSNPHRRPPDMYEVVKQLETMVKDMQLDDASLRGLAAEEA
jgi:eukaryotic-like serine/threonine-protein kinase